MINNMPKENEWYLQDTDDKSVNYGNKYRFRFEQFEAEKIRRLIKSYVWHNHQTGAMTLSSIYKNYSSFCKFNLFASQNHIDGLADFDANDADNYMTYLRMSKSKYTGKPLCYSTQKETFSNFRAVVYWGRIFAPELAPAQEVFLDIGYPGYHAKHKIEYIPDDVVKQINAALLTEENPYIKYGIIILFSTGMRRSELLTLEVGCVTPHLLNGDTLTLYDYKNRRQYRKFPINPICADAIAKLTEITAEIREKADVGIKKYLFLYEGTKRGNPNLINVVSKDVFRMWINGCTSYGKFYPGFMARHNITGSDGKIYKLKIQQFRKTVATDMFSKNVDLKTIQAFLRHANPETTRKYYADDKDIDHAALFERVGIIGNINHIDASVIANENELAWFRKNKDKGAKMRDGYCTKPIADGEICEKLVNHQKCYTCSRYITTPEYLQEHRDHLAELESQLANNIYGAHYAAHLSPTIAILKDIIGRLEAVRNES
ncbi:MAG: site-specific integrase [Clostridiaceae bacterium]|nr:site-specific integrase [Clostridiaceae bacterium]